ncbi:MAG: histone deacetylase [Anaerolineales bacterium]|nr:histone deacetylase [Anaerolineales bacterium]
MKDLIFFYPEKHEEHYSPNHPERPERIEAICDALRIANIWNEDRLVTPARIEEDVLAAIHNKGHLQRVATASARGSVIDADTYVTPASWRLAQNAAGGAIAVANAVYHREADKGFALCRPPGHHATPDRAMGFCLLNNVALAVEHILQSTEARRVAILDIDLHHGNGTQDIFYQRSDVFFCSIHQYPLYPMTGLIDEIGAGEGEGTNLNVPFPPYAGDQAREAALSEVILPSFEAYRPDMVFISAGADAHWRDPLGHQLASAKGYGNILARMREFADLHCNGRLVVLLEGGYDLEGGAASCLAISQALLDQEWEDPLGPSPLPEDIYWESRLQQVLDQWK